MKEQGKTQFDIEKCFQNELFLPHLAYRKGVLFAAQGQGTINDESLLRASLTDDPVELLTSGGRIIVFDGNHRTCYAILYRLLIPYQILPPETNTPHIYPFNVVFNEFKRRIGRVIDL